MKTLREELEEYKSKVLAAFDEIAQYADDHRERAFVGSIRNAIKDVELPLPRHHEKEPLVEISTSDLIAELERRRPPNDQD